MQANISQLKSNRRLLEQESCYRWCQIGTLINPSLASLASQTLGHPHLYGLIPSVYALGPKVRVCNAVWLTYESL